MRRLEPTSGDHSRSVAIDHDLWRSVSVHQDVIATMDDKGRHCQQIACLRLVVATGQHRVSGCCRSTRVNDA